MAEDAGYAFQLLQEHGVFLGLDVPMVPLASAANADNFIKSIHHAGFIGNIYYGVLKVSDGWIYYGWDSNLSSSEARSAAMQRWTNLYKT